MRIIKYLHDILSVSLYRCPCRNGREMREMLPLWKRGKRAMPSGRPVEGVLRKKPCRNGRESWEMLPLRKEGRR